MRDAHRLWFPTCDIMLLGGDWGVIILVKRHPTCGGGNGGGGTGVHGDASLNIRFNVIVYGRIV